MYNLYYHRKGLSTLIITIIYIIIVLITPNTAIAPKYETVYACEGKTLTIECLPGDLINLIRANYGRFSIAICNDPGNVDWSVNCMSPKSLRVLHSKCADKQNCSVLASTNMFGDPCPGTHKYLEAHYQCKSAAQTSTTTNRPSPPWLITSQPSVWRTSTVHNPTISKYTNDSDILGGMHDLDVASDKITTPMNTIPSSTPSTIGVQTSKSPVNPLAANSTTNKDRLKFLTITSPKTLLMSTTTISSIISSSSSLTQSSVSSMSPQTTTSTISNNLDHNVTKKKFSVDNNISAIIKLRENATPTVLVNNNINNDNYYCGPTTARNLFWNLTRVGEVNVQPCPGGATGIAKWRCILNTENPIVINNESDISNKLGNISIKSIWQPNTPDLTQCRSLWLNNLEVRVNQRDSSLSSIAQDLSQVTSSKTLYGGDMLVTTKIIQMISKKMLYDIETFPDQRQREASVLELLHGVVKTGSNLLDLSQQSSWLDLSFEDKMRVATSLLTGLEDNAFLLADTIIRERTVLEKLKNIFLSVRVLETRNIMGNEIFPDRSKDEWEVSQDQIELPRGALIENSEGGLVRIVFVAFDRLETILHPSPNLLESNKLNTGSFNLSAANGQIQHQERILNSKVISASLGKGRHIQLSQPIRLILNHLKIENVSNPTCVFWNYIDHAWSEDGCYVEMTNKTHTICMCNHLTNFAILMDVVNDNEITLLSLLDNNIRILIYISISICIILLLIAIATIKMFNGVFIKSCRTTIYKNLYISLLAIQIFFLIGLELNETNILCSFISPILHCSFMSAVGWMFFEGFQLYIMLTTDDMLLEVEKCSRILSYYLLTYGLSLLIVFIGVAIDPAVYSHADYCIWMKQTPLFYCTFVTPIIIFILANLIYTTMALIVMRRKYKTSLKNKEHTRLASARFYLRCSFIFLLIFVIGWTSGFLYMKNNKINLLSNIFDDANYVNDSITLMYGYIFVISNIMQGIYIFGFHCLQNEKIRREYCKYIQQQTWLPRCLRCSQTTPMSSQSSINNHPTNTLNPGEHHHHHHHHVNHEQQLGDGTGILQTGNGDVMSSQMGLAIGPNSNVIDGILGSGCSNLQQQHLRQNIMVERIQNHHSNTLNGQISPSSSSGSTHLIYNGPNIMQTNVHPDWNYHNPNDYLQQPASITELNNKNFNNYDDKYLYYERKIKKIKSNELATVGSPTHLHQQQQQMHHNTNYPQGEDELFYWQNNKHPLNMQDNELATSRKNIYPSYKKKLIHYDTAIANNSKSGAILPQSPYNQQQQDNFFQEQAHQQRYRQQQPSQHEYHLQSSSSGGSTNNAAQQFYNHQRHQIQQQHQQLYQEEPVYEEIVNSRLSTSHNGESHENDDEIDMDDDENINFNHNNDVDEDDEEDDDDDDLLDENVVNIKDELNLRQSLSRPLIKTIYGQQTSQGTLSVVPQQQQQQQSQKHVHPHQQPQLPSRNISAILDENNTVICYLEPLPK